MACFDNVAHFLGDSRGGGVIGKADYKTKGGSLSDLATAAQNLKGL